MEISEPLSPRSLSVRASAALDDLVEGIRAAPVTCGVIAAMSAVWVLEQALFGQTHGSRKIGYLAFGGLPNAEIIGRGSPEELWRFVASGLVHDSTSPLHLLVNASALAMVGSCIERAYGRLVVLATLVLGVVVGGATWMAASALGLAALPDYTIGLSGGICALVGMMLVYGYRERATLGSDEAHAMRLRATLGIALMVLIGLTITSLNDFAHAGGLVAGTAVALLLPVRGRQGRHSIGWRARLLFSTVVGLATVSMVFAGVNLVDRLTSSL